MTDIDTAQAYFGDPWPSGVCAYGQQEPTPVGEPCISCEEAIVAGDRGWWLQAIGGRVAVHRECGFRDVAGSIGHMVEKCSCYGGSLEDPPGFTRREAAKLAYAWAQTYWNRS